MLSFAYAFSNFFQPGIFWPELADFKPLQIIAALALLFSLRSRPGYDRRRSVSHPAIIALLAFTVTQCLSVMQSGFAAMLSEFGFWWLYPLFVLVSVRVITDEQALRRYVWGMVLGSMWIVGYGIWAVQQGLEEAENGGRAGAYGMYENHNDYTFIVVQVMPFVFLFWRAASGFVQRTLLLSAFLACVVGVFLSLSRGGMIAFVVEFALIVLVTMTKRQRWVLLPLVAALGGAAISYQYLKRAENQGDSYTAEDSETSREELWRAGYRMIQTHPLLGVGSRTFGEHAPEYGEISHDNLGKNSHNTYIEVAATSGLIGLYFYLRMIRQAIRDLRTAAPPETPAWLILTRQATLIALLTECFRGLFDAKSWDWSIYVLTVLAVVSGQLMRARAAEAAADPRALPGFPPLPDGPAGTPVPSNRPLPPTNHLPRSAPRPVPPATAARAPAAPRPAHGPRAPAGSGGPPDA